MGFPPFVLQQHIPLSLLGILSILAIAQQGVIGNPAEKDALLGLKATFNNPFLNYNWTCLRCNSTIAVPLKDTANNEVQDKPSYKNHSSSILLIFNVVLLLAIILLLVLYFNTSRKLNKIMKGQILTAKEVAEDVEMSVEKKIEIGEGTMMTVEERKELTFFDDKHKFQMGELLRASAEALGQGTMGNSYKARLNDGTTIVVKRLRDLKPLAKEEFEKILHHIDDLKHPNLLPFLAYYHSKDEKLLLYRYAQHGNLFHRLHGNFHQLVLFPFFVFIFSVILIISITYFNINSSILYFQSTNIMEPIDHPLQEPIIQNKPCFQSMYDFQNLI